MRKLYILLVFMFFIGGCTSKFDQRFGPIAVPMYTKPLAAYEKNHEIDFSKYHKFVMFHQKATNDEHDSNSILEKKLLFVLGNYFKGLGFEYVDNQDKADFIIGVSFTNKLESYYVPPSTNTIPWYIPGKTETTLSNNSGWISGYVGSEYFSGRSSGWSVETKKTPGYVLPITVTTPGGYISCYLPSLNIAFFDKESKNIIWSGSIITATHIYAPDKIIILQNLMLHLIIYGDGLKNIPLNFESFAKKESNCLGVIMGILTFDGYNFNPVILGVFIDSPAYNHGLEPGDVITKLNGRNTLNWSISDFYNALDIWLPPKSRPKIDKNKVDHYPSSVAL